MNSKNPNGESDFVSGFRENAGPSEWIQRLTGSYGLILSLQGEGAVSIGGDRLTLAAGSLALLKPVLKHRFHIRNTWTYLWFHFLPRPHIVHALEWPEVIPGVGVAMLPPAELETVRKELEEAHKLECHRPDGWNALAYLLAESAVVRGSNRIMSEASEADSRIRLAQELLTETADGRPVRAFAGGVVCEVPSGDGRFTPAVPGVCDSAPGGAASGVLRAFRCGDRRPGWNA